MKIPTDRRERGFTLVELLVVIAIIAVLASAAFMAGNAAIQKAHMTTALAVATAMEKAVTDFTTEYGGVPSTQATDETYKTDESSGVDLINILMAKETADPPVNLRKLNFFTAKEGKKVGTSGTKGLIYNTNDTIQGLYDPWGNGYYVLIDSDGDTDETVDPPKVGNDAATRSALHRRVAVWSAGADKIVGGTHKTDDFKSW